MGKRRNTAKTGDKALYNSRQRVASASSNNTKKKNEDDPMYNEIDHFHNERDEEYISLGNQADYNGDGEDEDLTGNKESVLDLGAGVGESSSDDDDSDSDDSDEEHDGKQKQNRDINPTHHSDDNTSSSESESDDDDDLKDELSSPDDPRNWGKKKSLYYHGDTADLEIGQEEEDAFLEEEAAKEIQATRFQEMDEDDFVLSEHEDEEKDVSEKKKSHKAGVMLQATRDVSKLTKKEARKLLQKQHPELLPMVSYFSYIVKDLKDKTQVATQALLDGQGTAESVGATLHGQQYLLTKAMIQKAIALNSVMYLLLKTASVADEDGTSNIQAHPIMDQLKSFYSALEKFEEKVQKETDGIEEQLENLVKAAALLTHARADDESGDDHSKNSEDEDLEASEMKLKNEEQVQKSDEDKEVLEEEKRAQAMAMAAQEKQKNFQTSMNEVRFGLRPSEIRDSSKVSRKRMADILDDFGDLEEADKKSSARFLASTINTLEQRSKAASRKRRPAPIAEELDDLNEDDQLAQGIKMMEEELGKLDDSDEDDNDNPRGGEDSNDEHMTDPDANDESMEFYNAIAKKSKSQKALKKSLYQVAPKFPRTDSEVDGERAINRTILKNRGLVAHKAKINRNPRVKKREQYRKALIRRKGAVREVREGEGHRYGGEGTGIKSGISRSRKLSSK